MENIKVVKNSTGEELACVPFSIDDISHTLKVQKRCLEIVLPTEEYEALKKQNGVDKEVEDLTLVVNGKEVLFKNANFEFVKPSPSLVHHPNSVVKLYYDKSITA